MKKGIRRILSGLLCAGVLALGIPAPSRALTLTAVNDSILPLSDSTMPARLGGEVYVPYSVFSQLGVSASSSDGVLDLSANGETLSFSPAEGYVYDQNLNSYSTPAYSMNGTTYGPVKLCCGKFGLSYSTLAVAGETVLRVTDGSASSDSAFAAAKSGTIENTINSYKGISSANGSSSNGASSNGGTAAKPDETSIPKVEEKPARKPARVYLTFYGAPDKNTAAVLDTLRGSGRTAAFFLPVKSADWTDDTVRRIAAEGHTLALLLDADEKASGDALVERKRAAAPADRRTDAHRLGIHRLCTAFPGAARRADRRRLPPVGRDAGRRGRKGDGGPRLRRNRAALFRNERHSRAQPAPQQGNRRSGRADLRLYVAAGHPVRDDLARPHAHQRRKRDKIIQAAPQLPLCGIASKTACFHGFRSKAGGFSKIESFLRA